MASYGVLEEHTILDPDFSILAFAFCWACGLSWNEAWANVKSSLLDITMSVMFVEYRVSSISFVQIKAFSGFFCFFVFFFFF
jgi:hypothetical protein